MEKIKINKAKNRPGKADKEASNNRKRLYLFLKVISLAFIVIFCIMLIFGIIRWYDFKSSHNSYPMQQSQIDMARNAVSADLDSAGDNISDYDVRISDDVR
ncbi:MAG: hypothetical protein NT001_04125, partial [Candidatus Woesearchaeota archaeon]|nr:hypothetical protein [Candidatus Woesearchaeota archaeon]